MSGKLGRREVLGLAAVGALAGQVQAQPAAREAFEQNRRLGRGINFGNMLEAPREGEWGLSVREEYFDAVKEAGFNSIRVPIRWPAHAETAAPFTIEPQFAKRVDWVVDQALKRGLTTIINIHHFEDLDKEPEKNVERFRALWRQIAERYRDRPDRLLFELHNEPHDALNDERWARIFPQALAVVRQSNPNRPVIIGPSQWNNVDHLARLSLPEGDRNLIGTFHYYSPFQFTHQGAEWAQGSEKWLGTTWTGTDAQLEALRKDFDKAAKWSQEQRRPVFLGEFGAYSKADMDSRVRWTQAVTREAEKRGFSWAYWELASGFGAYDPKAHAWRTPLLQALLPKK